MNIRPVRVVWKEPPWGRQHHHIRAEMAKWFRNTYKVQVLCPRGFPKHAGEMEVWEFFEKRYDP